MLKQSAFANHAYPWGGSTGMVAAMNWGGLAATWAEPRKYRIPIKVPNSPVLYLRAPLAWFEHKSSDYGTVRNRSNTGLKGNNSKPTQTNH